MLFHEVCLLTKLILYMSWGQNGFQQATQNVVTQGLLDLNPAKSHLNSPEHDALDEACSSCNCCICCKKGKHLLTDAD